MSRRTPRNGLLVVMTMPASDPALEAALAPRLRLLGIAPDRVTLLAPRGTRPPSFAADHVAVRTVPVAAWPVVAFGPLLHALVTRRPALVAAQDEWSALLLSLVPRRLRRWRYVLDKWGLPVEESELRRKSRSKIEVLRRMERVNLRRADRVACITPFMADLMRARGLRHDPVVVPNFATEDELVDPEHPLPDPPRVAYVGGGQVWQCPDETIDLLARLKDRRPDADVVVATTDPGLREAAAARGIRTVTLTRDDAIALVGSCTAVVVLRRDDPAVRAASPTKFREALSQGTPVLTSGAAWEHVPRLAELGFAHIVDVDTPDVDAVARWLATIAALEPGEVARLRREALRVYDVARYRADLARHYAEVVS